MRIGLVGCGRLAERGYLPAAARSPRVELVAVADPDIVRRSAVVALASERGMHVGPHPNAAALLACTDVDGLVLASPASAHLADAELATAAGVPVLVEKPPAPDAVGAAALVALGDGVRIGFNRRFDPTVARVRDALPADGPLDVHLRLAYRRARWSAHAVRDEVLLDLVPHLVDLARWLTAGEVRSVAAGAVATDRAELHLGLDRGRATVIAAADRLHEERIEVRDATGRVVAEHRVGGPLGAIGGRARALRDRATGRSTPHPLVVSLAAQLDAFADAVRGDGCATLARGADGLAAMAVVDASRTSAAAGGSAVPVPELREPTC